MAQPSKGPLPFGVGIFPDGTSYSQGKAGRWVGADKIRFNPSTGKAQPIGGCVTLVTTPTVGICRGAHSWGDRTGVKYTAVGTHTKLYATYKGQLVNITPIRRTANVTGAFSTTAGSSIVTIADTHGAVIGDTVAVTAMTGAGGLTLAGDYLVRTTPSSGLLTVDAGTPAIIDSSATGNATLTYEISIGKQDGIAGLGYGAGTYSRGTWSSAISGDLFPRTWCLDNFGQILIANPRGGSLYSWDPTTPTVRATIIANAPVAVNFMFVTAERIIVALGCLNPTLGAIDPMYLQWCDQEDMTDWTATETNFAGDLVLAEGSRIVGATKSDGETLIHTDTGYYTFRWTNDPALAYGAFHKPGNCGLIGPNASIQLGSRRYWVGNNKQLWYDDGGGPQILVCSGHDTVFNDIAANQQDKIVLGSISAFGEVIMLYPAAQDGKEVSRYAKYNSTLQCWDFGTIDRTFWRDQGVLSNPLAVGLDGYVYLHESGINWNGAPMTSRLTSGFIDIGNGNVAMEILGLTPDIAEFQGSLDFTVMTRDKPNTAITTDGPYTILPATDIDDLRSEGRQLALEFTSTGDANFWQLGTIQLTTQPSGARP